MRQFLFQGKEESMGLLDNEFTCPNKHVFKANAKIRARCPQCGQMARRDFTLDPPKVDLTKEPKKPVERTTLIRQGRPPRMTKASTRFKKPTKSPAKTVAKAKSALPKTLRKTAVPATRASASGLIRHRTLKGKVTPTIKRPPSKTAVARHVSEGRPQRHGSYFDEVIDKYGRL